MYESSIAFEMIRDNGKLNLSNTLKSEKVILRAESFPQSSKTANEIVHLLTNGSESVFKTQFSKNIRMLKAVLEYPNFLLPLSPLCASAASLSLKVSSPRCAERRWCHTFDNDTLRDWSFT